MTRANASTAPAHSERNMQQGICAVLVDNGWRHEFGDNKRYDKKLALFPDDLAGWVRDSQPDIWDVLTSKHGDRAAAMLAARVRKALDERGTLDVIRTGIDMLGVRRTIQLAQFRPASGMNADLSARYEANRLRVVEEVVYSTAHAGRLDLVLFLNGIPTATAELKSDFSQSVDDAVAQYRHDRQPAAAGNTAEPLLSFPSGALVHFAVSTRDVMMTTRLAGEATRFLPFNRGHDGGKGNPPDERGHATAYLWHDVWTRDSWLDIIGRYLVTKRDEKNQIAATFFPRYHQLDATRKLSAAVLEEGPGGAYLIQHSAGSGKTASIAWTAHFLSSLHGPGGNGSDDRKVFSTVIVISDRRVIDGQLQEALFDFERTRGVVETIKNTGEAKSGQLATALAGGKKIIVCTIQTFPYALNAVRDLSAAEGKKFAVIADEAHSSQSGEAAAKLREMLASDADADSDDYEDVMAAQMAARASDGGITYVAFTATPKTKTLELFGRKDDSGIPRAFHVYSMRQAIEEGFILDVLKNYIPYKTAFKLAQAGKEIDSREVERGEATKAIMQWVRLHPHNIAQKVGIAVEHFRNSVAPLLGGRAKAMVVLASRIEAVRWKQAVDKYIAEKGYGYSTLVAFSGEVEDAAIGSDPVRETTAALNPTLNARDIRDAFADDDDCRLLLVANKFQTGFDEPRLCGMYVDRRLAGVQAVQTLSRLNRAHPGKDTTYVLDFVNSADEVLAAFRTYYETAELETVTDPEKVFQLRSDLDAGGWYDTPEVERAAKIAMRPDFTHARLSAALAPVAQRLMTRYSDARDVHRGGGPAAGDAKDRMDALSKMKGDMETYVRLYTFLSQIYDYGNTDFEKRFWFYKYLVKLLAFHRERDVVDTSQLELTHHAVRDLGTADMRLGGDGNSGDPLKPLTDAGSGKVQEKERALLDEIIARVNDLFGGDYPPEVVTRFVDTTLRTQILQSKGLAVQAANNTKSQFAASPTLDKELFDALLDALATHEEIGGRALGSDSIRKDLKSILLGPGQLYEQFRERQGLEVEV